MKIGAIIKAEQPVIHREFNRQINKAKKRRRGNEENLSFSYIAKLMTEKTDVDESKCKGRG